MDASKLSQIIFNNKPRRVYKANRSATISFSDAKRVHTALREFNDLSANSVFQGIIESIEAAEQDSKSLDMKGAGKGPRGQRGSIVHSTASIQQKMAAL